jgi:hypothetical protein
VITSTTATGSEPAAGQRACRCGVSPRVATYPSSTDDPEAGDRSTAIEAVKPGPFESPIMQHLIVKGDPGIRKDAVIDYDGEEQVCFSIQRQGDYHGPDEVQLWCTIGTPDERERFEKRRYVQHWLDVDAVDADALDVVTTRG